jgi:hypothetical protein
METNEPEIVKNLKRLTTLYFKTLKPRTDNSNEYLAQIKIQNHFELGCIITDMLKLCILALDHDMHNVREKKNQSINVSLILETVLQLFPLDEMEFLGYVREIAEE